MGPVALVLAFVISAQTVPAQASLWAHVSRRYSPPQLDDFSLSASQEKSVFEVLESRERLDFPDLSAEEITRECLTGLEVRTIPASRARKVLVVRAGPDCCGATGNCPMWLIRFDRGIPTVLASPQQDFFGWPWSVQPTIRYGYRDIVIGLRMGGGETDLAYFRYDGKSYRRIGTAIMAGIEQTITPVPGSHWPP